LRELPERFAEEGLLSPEEIPPAGAVALFYVNFGENGTKVRVLVTEPLQNEDIFYLSNTNLSSFR
jgi:hypothetical protein